MGKYVPTVLGRTGNLRERGLNALDQSTKTPGKKGDGGGTRSRRMANCDCKYKLKSKILGFFMKSSSGFAGVQERVRAAVPELKLPHSIEYNAVTVLCALSKEGRHAPQNVLSREFLKFTHASLEEAGRKSKKASVIEDSCLGGKQHKNDGLCYPYSVAQLGEPSPPGVKQGRSQFTVWPRQRNRDWLFSRAPSLSAHHLLFLSSPGSGPGTDLTSLRVTGAQPGC